jgi:CSLREA domain-containing protein
MRRFAFWTVALGLLVAALPPAASASTTFRVTRIDDPAPGSCTAAACSLREAVTAANADAAPDVVLLPAGTYTLTLGPLPAIVQPLTVAGAGAAATRITGSTATGPSATLRAGVAVVSAPTTFADLTLTGNTATVDDPATQSVTVGAGALVANATALTLVRTVVSANAQSSQATVGAGGVAGNVSTLTVIDSTVTANDKTRSGTVVAGGLASGNGELVLRGSTVAANTVTVTSATVAAGGLAVNAGAADVLNSTVAENAVASSGIVGQRTGGLAASTTAGESVSIRFSTVAGNRSDSTGAANLRLSGDTSLTASIVAGGSAAAGPNCASAGGFASGGSNVEDAATCGLAGPGDLASTDPQLGALADNGGPTPTRAPAPSSPAVDLVQGAAGAACPGTDQRGTRRPQLARCDAGSFELVPSVPVNTARPAIAGAVRQGRLVTCQTGTWLGVPAFTVAWLREGAPIPGAAALTYRLTRRDVGAALQCQVTARNAAGSAVAESAPRAGQRACIVPRLVRANLRTAGLRLARAGCRRGAVTTRFSRTTKAGVVLAQAPGQGSNQPFGTPVRLVVTRGPRR